MGTPITFDPTAIAAIQAVGVEIANKVVEGQVRQRTTEDAAAPNGRNLPRPVCPTYDHSSTTSWSGFLSRFNTYRSITGIDANQSKSFLHLSLIDQASIIGIDYSPDRHQNKTFQQYEELLGQVFSPASEKALNRVRFLERRQGNDETTQSYLTAKKSLFSIAYGSNVTNRDLLQTLYSESAKGLLHPEVSRAVLTKLETFASFTDLLSAANNAVATERSLCITGKSSVTAGLQSISGSADPASMPMARGPMGTSTSSTDAVGGSASSEVVQMDINTIGAVAADIFADPDVAAYLPDGVVNAVMGSNAFKCYNDYV